VRHVVNWVWPLRRDDAAWDVPRHRLCTCTVLIALLIGFSAACQPIRPVTPPATTPAVEPTVATAAPAEGQLIDIGGRRLYLLCTGTGERTILLEAGLNAGHEGWALVQPAASRYGRVCSYDRAGIGLSDPAPSPRTSAEIVADLHALVTAAELPGPYVLAGHSFGALHVRLYAAAYPEEVLGLVLVDPVHEDWWAQALAVLPPATADEAPLVAALRQDLAASGGPPEANAEELDIAASAAQVRATGDLGRLPLIVMTAGVPDLLPPGLPAEVQEPLVTLLQRELPQDLAQRTPNSLLLTVPGSGHDIPRQQPDVIVAAIKTVVELEP
jgi:pimeloyl-ACP methyl ester carboxylesterase